MAFENALDAVVEFYETLTPSTLDQLSTIYADEAAFKDPFNDVHGIAAIHAIFAHMFRQTTNPRFVVVERVLEGNRAFLVWTFHFETKGFSRREFVIQGASYVQFHANGKVISHRDYWDPAEELYEKIPFLRGLMRLLKKIARQ